jgi:crossover junction endodeoxyribonuclease RuvC
VTTASGASGASGASAGGVTILGLDPGTRHFGWGVVRRVGTRLTHVAHGVVSVGGKETAPLGERLVAIEIALIEVVAKYAPLEASIESLFFAKDASAAAKLGHARGVGLLVCARGGLAVFEYPPARVKRTVTGAGRADKAQVAHMIRVMLGLTTTPPADAADALAIAVTHLQGRALPGTREPISRDISNR